MLFSIWSKFIAKLRQGKYSGFQMSMLSNNIYKSDYLNLKKISYTVNFSLSICEFNQFWQLLCSFVLHRKCILKTWIRAEAYSKRPRGKLAYDTRQKTLCLDLLINGIKTILTSLKTSVFVHLREDMSLGGVKSLSLWLIQTPRRPVPKSDGSDYHNLFDGIPT